MFKLALPLSVSLIASILVTASGCAVESMQSTDVTDDALHGTRVDPPTSGRGTHDLFYLGSPAFLWAKACDFREPCQYGCGAWVRATNGEYTFQPDELYFSAPVGGAACGQKATFCKGSNCVTATRIESSDQNQHFEGSAELIRRLGGFPSDSGGGTVTDVRISWGSNLEPGSSGSGGGNDKCIDKDGIARPQSYVLNGCACGPKGRAGDSDGDGWVCKPLEKQGNCADKCIDKEGVCRPQSYVLNGCACGSKGRAGDTDSDGWICK
jgi:hypothetical protein